MKIYSPSKNTFYPPEFRDDYEASGTWPDDGIEVDDEIFHAVVSNRPLDKIMVCDEDGYPCLADRPAPTTAELQAQTNAEARAYLAETDWYISRKAETGKAVPADILTERAAARARVVD
jgi:hypothetical protein